MTVVDPADNSGWIGGLVIDAPQQGRGLGRATVGELLRRFREEGRSGAALSYNPADVRARMLYSSLGFEVTGEFEDDEPVARKNF